jgi:hypothetical protein
LNERRNAGVIFGSVKIVIKIAALDVVGRVEINESLWGPLFHAQFQEFKRILASNRDSLSHGCNGLDSVHELGRVVPGVDLPWPGLVPAADDSSI